MIHYRHFALLLCLLAGVVGRTTVAAADYTRYLFVYFPSNNDENIYYALSDNGYDYTPMNDGQMIVSADTISLKKGVRDPHILRGEDGYFYMVLTDMRCAEGWDSNRGLVMMKSRDLVNWTHSTVHFPEKYEGTIYEKVTRVWAPETIWDPQAQKYMVYFSLLTNDGSIPYDKVFYCYANEDFTDLEGEPIYLYDRGSATIDMDIVFNEKDQLYHAFYKNEGSGGICQVTATTLTAPAGQEGSQWSEPSGTLQQTTKAVEGAGVFKLIDEDTWILMYDCYMNGHYQFCSSTDLINFTFVQDTYTSGAFTPRHGTVLPVTDAEVAAIEKYLTDKEKEKAAKELLEKKQSLLQDITDAKQMNVTVSDIEEALQQETLTKEEVEALRQTLNVRVFEEGLPRYAEDKTDLIGEWTCYNETDRQDQHWDGGGTSTYYEQKDGWGGSAWQMSMEQQLTLPAGSYVLAATGRSASEAVVATMSIDDHSVRFPTKSDKGYGVNTDGQATFDPEATYANNGMGRGWEWRYIPFFLETEQDVTLRLQAIVENARYQWVSICNLRLLYTSELPTAVTSPLSPASSHTRVYTVAGQQASRLHEGVYIVRQADGRSQKVLRGK